MSLFSNKSAELLTILIVITFILFAVMGFGGWLIDLSSRECRSDKQCPGDNYCGSDFACHQIPVIEKTIVQNNFVVPSIIIGIAIVLSSIILKSGKMPFGKNSRHEMGKEHEYKNEYKSPLKTP